VTASNQNGGTSDPYLWQKYMANYEENCKSEPANHNSIEHLPSRPAWQFFRDIMLRLHTLAWIPYKNNIHESDEINSKESSEFQELELLFRTHGWPAKFDGPGFDVAAKRYEEFNRVRHAAKEPGESIKRNEEMFELYNKRFQAIRVRKSGGVWDEDPNKPALEVAKLDEELEKERVSLGYTKRALDETRELLRTERSESQMITRAWKRHLEGHIKWLQNNIDYVTGREDVESREAQLSEWEDHKKRINGWLVHVELLPKTVEQAIRPNSGGVFGMDW
jgi:hypothetical protein